MHDSGGRDLKRWRSALAALAAAAVTACSDGAGDSSSGAAATPAVAAGRQVYAANCTACHNQDPRQAGALGPALAGSSEELLAAKVLRGVYPPGYTPKRESRAMAPLPHLEKEIPALAAYLASVAEVP